MKSYARSKRLFDQAQSLITGGVNSPVRAFAAVGGSPVFFEKAAGSRFTDPDGNAYTDFCLSWGPLILGHAHPDVVAASTEALREGLSFGACSRREVELAELVLEAFPEFDRTRFVSSGTEAVMTAIRLARGVTGRPQILKFDGCYHGHSDSLLVKAGSGLITQPIASSLGVPPALAELTRVAPLDDEAAVEAIFAAHGKEIAAVIIEPLPANSGLLRQRDAFLRFLREITSRYGALLIFDEVISGLRLRFGGYMHEVGLRPDLVTLGKIVGGGMPVGAVVGPAEIMNHLAPLGKVYQAGTLSGNPVSMAAGKATLLRLKEGSVYRHLDDLGRFADETFDRITASRPDFQVFRVGSILWFYLSEGEWPRRPDSASPNAIERYNSRYRALLDLGFYLAPSAWEVAFLSDAHTKEDLAGLAQAWETVLKP